MPSLPPRLCSRCRRPVPPNVRCAACYPQVQRSSDVRRGSASARGYGQRHRKVFRAGVLQRDPLCVLCGRVATVADHHPLDRRTLVERGMDADDPEHGRGLCAACHNRSTAQAQPGGWNAR